MFMVFCSRAHCLRMCPYQLLKVIRVQVDPFIPINRPWSSYQYRFILWLIVVYLSQKNVFSNEKNTTLILGRFEYKSMSFAVWLWASLQFCFSCTSEQGFKDWETLVFPDLWIPTSEDDFMESIKYEPKRRKSVIVKAMHFLKRKYCQFDEFIIPLLLNDIPLLAGRCVIFHLESAKKASKDPQNRL